MSGHNFKATHTSYSNLAFRCHSFPFSTIDCSTFATAVRNRPAHQPLTTSSRLSSSSDSTMPSSPYRKCAELNSTPPHGAGAIQGLPLPAPPQGPCGGPCNGTGCWSRSSADRVENRELPGCGFCGVCGVCEARVLYLRQSNCHCKLCLMAHARPVVGLGVMCPMG